MREYENEKDVNHMAVGKSQPNLTRTGDFGQTCRDRTLHQRILDSMLKCIEAVLAAYIGPKPYKDTVCPVSHHIKTANGLLC